MAKKKKKTAGRRTDAELAPLYGQVHELVNGGMTIQDACVEIGVGTSQYHGWRRKQERLGRLRPALEQVGASGTSNGEPRSEDQDAKYLAYIEERLASMKKLNLRLLDAVRESMI